MTRSSVLVRFSGGHERSRRINREQSALDLAVRRSLETFTRAVSADTAVWKPDCKGSRRALAERQRIKRSRSLEKKGRLQTGRSLPAQDGSRDVFFSSGVITACLEEGSIPVHRLVS